MKKLNLVLLIICTLSVWQIKGQTGADCANAIGIVQPSSQTYVSGVNEQWYLFKASSTTVQFDVTQHTNQVNIRKIELYAGSCNTLTLLGRDSLTSSIDTAVSIQASNLTVPTIYYARVVFVDKVNNYNYNLTLSPQATDPIIIWENPDGTSGNCSNFLTNPICETTICLGEAICFSYNIQFGFNGASYANYANNHTTLFFSDGGSIVVENNQYTGPNPTGCVNYTPTAVGTITTTGVNNSVFTIHVVAPTLPLYSVSIPNPVCLGECVTFTSLNSPVANYSFTSNDPYNPCPSGGFGTLGNSFIFTNTGTNTVIYIRLMQGIPVYKRLLFL